MRPPVFCCGQRHFGPVCLDGTFMCAICFGTARQPDAYVDAGGQAWDLCRTCGEREQAAKRCTDWQREPHSSREICPCGHYAVVHMKDEGCWQCAGGYPPAPYWSSAWKERTEHG